MPQTLTGEEQTPEDRAAQDALRRRGPLPDHIAVIMDGNGRWAEQRGKMRAVGHREGVRSVRDVTEACTQLGVGYLTLYTFSTENWMRPAHEVNALMRLLVRTIRRERRRLLDNGVRLRTLGALEELPARARRALQETAEATAANERLTLSLALSYSGRWDLARAARRLARQAQRGVLDPDAIDEDRVGAMLSTAALPDPDLLIRTGGEKRLSNFLLWELAYAEMRVTACYWPAFRRAQLYEAIRDFQDRDRRYGRLSAPEEQTEEQTEEPALEAEAPTEA